ncbi:hypothetical protein K788_0002367 [Paraburkholderia caribensis MBA4]|uniref:Uncharacterized protein n=1 Tax=Paraburkholderia caribensis MBA4 TaxID=1323664 RepID=A0A0P0R9R1_9BURK|nr:hypothetical protein [Paraburkholderia caribensis]ALL64863.1 hypothetical protein K788_0002367 [Paraburkholderia caribensis MBA4]
MSSDPSDNEPTSAAARPPRRADEIEKDFLDLLMSGIPSDVAHDKFERLWDETNALAASSMMSAQGLPYIALLKRMHTAFAERYPR